jgi:hypothetical protein
MSAQVISFEKGRTSRLYLKGPGKAGSGLIDIVGARQARDLPLLELCCQFHSTPVPQVRPAAVFGTVFVGLEADRRVKRLMYWCVPLYGR